MLGEVRRSRARSQLEVSSRVCAQAVRWAGTAGRARPPGEAGFGLWLALGGCGSCLQLGQEGWPVAPPYMDVCVYPGEISALAQTIIGSFAGAPPVVVTMTSEQSFHGVSLRANL